jgi:hypothetical protein
MKEPKSNAGSVSFNKTGLTGDDKNKERRCSNLIARRSSEEDRARVGMRFGTKDPV